MAIKKLNGMTVEAEDGYFPKEVVDMLNKRLEEEKVKNKKAEAPATKSTKKSEKRDK